MHLKPYPVHKPENPFNDPDNIVSTLKQTRPRKLIGLKPYPAHHILTRKPLTLAAATLFMPAAVVAPHAPATLPSSATTLCSGHVGPLLSSNGDPRRCFSKIQRPASAANLDDGERPLGLSLHRTVPAVGLLPSYAVALMGRCLTPMATQKGRRWSRKLMTRKGHQSL